jgi:type II secretory pathway pseudopilin PulG
MYRRTRSGQVGLILLIVMGVVIALAMSLASRSLSDTVLSRQEQESSVAFRLAESGIESALNSIRTGSVPSNSTVQTSGIFSATYGVESLTSYALFVREGEIANLDLEGSDVSAPLLISWTKLSDQGENKTTCADGSGNAPAALEVVAIKSDGTVAFNYYNPYDCVVSGNNFSDESELGDDPYRSQVSYTVPANTKYLRLRPLYADATIAVAGAGITETQLYVIQSTATCGDAKKDIEVKRGLEAPPSIFDFALFSGTTIIK